MIIQVRGTSGSGKSTVVRKVMESLGDWSPEFIDGRKRPIRYRHKRYKGLVVLGHYEIDCGGCDTIGSAPKVFEAVQDTKFTVLLSEGLLWGEDVKWTLQLDDVRAVFLTTSPQECLKRVEIRQNGREPADRDRVWRKLSKRVETIDRARVRLESAGVKCVKCSSARAPRVIERWIKNSLGSQYRP